MVKHREDLALGEALRGLLFQACTPPSMVRTELSHGSNHANHGAVLQGIDQCLSGGGQAAVQPGSQAAPVQEHLDPFPQQLDPLYWLLIKGSSRSDSEGDSHVSKQVSYRKF